MQRGKIVRGILLLFLVGVILIGSVGYRYYRMIYRSNIVTNKEDNEVYVFIATDSDYDDVKNILDTFLIDKSSYEWVALKKNYQNNIRPGRYLIKEGMSNNTLVNKLRGGMQSPVQVVFNQIRTKKQMAGCIANQIEADSIDIIELLTNNEFLVEYNLTPQTVMCVFIPNTYEIYWNTDAEGFFKRMYNEYDKFWTDTRLEKTERIGLNQYEVSTLASIVEEETVKRDEMPIVAGVYMNRLAKGMRLQADPTVMFAWDDFSIKRVLKYHLEIESPYNTYEYTGLPPGPISMPSIAALDAVLNYQKHDYLYFCAKEDFSGYHYFSKTLAQHNRYAKLYQQALNKNKIYK